MLNKKDLLVGTTRVKKRRPGGSVRVSNAVKIPPGTESSRLITRLFLINLAQKLHAHSNERGWSNSGLQMSRGDAVAKSHSSNNSSFIPLPLDGDCLAGFYLRPTVIFLPLFSPCTSVLNIVFDLIFPRLAGVELCPNPRGFVLSLCCFFFTNLLNN